MNENEIARIKNKLIDHLDHYLQEYDAQEFSFHTLISDELNFVISCAFDAIFDLFDFDKIHEDKAKRILFYLLDQR